MKHFFYSSVDSDLGITHFIFLVLFSECGRGQFRCRCGVPHCIEGSKVKDGTKDCEDGSDEGKHLKKWNC